MHRLIGLALALTLVCGAAKAAEPQKSVVFFEPWSGALGDSAIGTVADAAARAKQSAAAVVTVCGFASTIGGKQANQLLSKLRAQIVVDQLVTDGVDPARIRSNAEGEVPFALTPLESRRVEITVAGE